MKRETRTKRNPHTLDIVVDYSYLPSSPSFDAKRGGKPAAKEIEKRCIQCLQKDKSGAQSSYISFVHAVIMSTSTASELIEAQLTSLDDTDCYASVWAEILDQQKQSAAFNKNGSYASSSSSLLKSSWGGRGRGGRGCGRRTIQPFDIVVDSVRLQYLQGDVCLLEKAKLKLLQQRVYALIGKNGCGKSTLLQRMHAQKIPGWSSLWTTLYLPSELPKEFLSYSPIDVIMKYYDELHQNSIAVTEAHIAELEDKLNSLDAEQEQEEIERVCEKLSTLEEQLDFDRSAVEQQAFEVLNIFGLNDVNNNHNNNNNVTSCNDLSRGHQKYVLLSVATVCSFPNLLCLDEPTSGLDIFGLLQLRRIIEESNSTIVIVSHDVDLINDVATDIIAMEGRDLHYYPGNYDSYRLVKDQQGLHELRQSVAMERKKENLKKTLQNIKDQPVPKRRGGAKKKAKAVQAQRKKLEWHAEAERAASNSNATNAVPMPARRKDLTATQRLKLAESMKSVPDKAVQFMFRPTSSIWGEPLITALEVGHGFDVKLIASSTLPESVFIEESGECGKMKIVKRDGFLFDQIDLCIEEGSRNCILGPAASGKSTLLKVLTKKTVPVEGDVHFASGLQVAYVDSQTVDSIISSLSETTTALEYCLGRNPQKSEQDLRGHLTSFGLNPTAQAKTPVRFLSGGEKFRFTLASAMVDNPPLLCLDDPTCNLDVESVQALVYGLQKWNGTLLMISEDASFVRSLEDVKCVVLVPEEGKLRHVDGGIDMYLRSFRL